MTTLQILGAPQSPLVWATRMATIEKGIAADFIDARPHSPEIDAIQPFGKIPVMRHGDVELGESRAIAHYIDGLSEANPLVPRDLAGAARTEQWIMHFHTEYVPAMLARYIVQYFFPQTSDGTPDRTAIQAALPALENAIGVLDRRMEPRDYVAGAFSLADLFFGPVLHYVNTLPEGARMIAAAPHVSAYLDRLSSRAAFKATFPPPLPGREAA
jgi:glutathione S-transferase